MTPSSYRILTGATRFVVLIAIGAPVLWLRDVNAARTLAAVAALWLVAHLVGVWRGRPNFIAILAESAGIGLISGLVVTVSPELLATMVVAPFAAGLARGLWGVVLSISTEFAVFLVVSPLMADGLSGEAGTEAFRWAIGAIAMGVIGNFVYRQSLRASAGDAAYLQARDLLVSLANLSGELRGGLDVPTVSDEIFATVSDRLPLRGARLAVIQSGTATDVRAFGEVAGDPDVSIPIEPIARLDLWPLEHSPDPAELSLIAADLRDLSVRLEAAVLFARFRDLATADERRRLAREMHDGVVQDLVALGYQLDGLQARAESPEVADRIGDTRRRITGMVQEVRRSIQALSTAIPQGLGAAIEATATRLSTDSGIPIQVTHAPAGEALTADVESEIHRIVGEAMTNAVKHSSASRIEVDCAIQAPLAVITVTDDGVGMGQARPDSYGLTSMRERAALIGADLQISEPVGGGVQVRLTLGGNDE